MASPARPLVVVGDVHLSHGGRSETGRELGRLFQLYPGAELVLNGDIFNLSLDAPARDPVDSVLAMLAAEPELRTALRAHVSGGGTVTLLPGNHDAALATPALRAPLLALLELGESAPLAVERWFLRRNGVHVEHGHAYDPDNAPTHPLAVPALATEPLGVALTRRFLAPNRAFDFAHATEITPVEALARAVRVFGARMPLVLARYFRESAKFCKEAGFRSEHLDELRVGDELVRAVAEETGLEEARIRAVLDDRPRPTHESFERAFFRLYFDRVAGTVATGAFVGLWALSRSRTALGLGALAALYLTESVRGRNRYEGLPVRRLRAASERVRELTGAKTVIFGHTHVAELADGYANHGSFTYRDGPGRPYAYVNGAVELRTLSPG
jgi:UDP-2,3-diacylglucosamine pyrophosphatase LpxH